MRLSGAMKWRRLSGAVEVALADLVLLRVEVLLAARARGAVLHELERGAVDAVVRGERGGEDEAAHERGRPPVCRYSVRMSGVFGQKFGRKYSATSVASAPRGTR
jgi:hypothetical protein